MSNSWDDMRKAKEEEYFTRKNNEALSRLKAKEVQSKPRLSPITGEPMLQEVVHGVVIDRCQSSGGIWLDSGELEQLIAAAKHEEDGKNWITSFLQTLSKS